MYKITDEDSSRTGYNKFDNMIIYYESDSIQEVRIANIVLFGRASKVWVKDSDNTEIEYIVDNFSEIPISIEYLSELENNMYMVGFSGIKWIINEDYVSILQGYADIVENNIAFFLEQCSNSNSQVDETENVIEERNISELSGIEFEQLCQKLMAKMNFEVETTKASGDGGIDLIAYNHQPFTQGKYIVQCKRYTGSVGEPVIRDLYGVVMSERANKGILITTGTFTTSAVSFATGKPIELIDGIKLNSLLNNYDIHSEHSSDGSLVSQLNNIFDYTFISQEIKKNPNNIKVRSFLIDKLFEIFINRFEYNITNRVRLEQELIMNIEYILNIKNSKDRRLCLTQDVYKYALSTLELSKGNLFESLQYLLNILDGYEMKKCIMECNKCSDYDTINSFDTLASILINVVQIYNILKLDKKRESFLKKYDRIWHLKLREVTIIDDNFDSFESQQLRNFLLYPDELYLISALNYSNTDSVEKSTYNICYNEEHDIFVDRSFWVFSYEVHVNCNEKDDSITFSGISVPMKISEIREKNKQKIEIMY